MGLEQQLEAISPLRLPYNSPTSPLHLPYLQVGLEQQLEANSPLVAMLRTQVLCYPYPYPYPYP